MRTAADELVPLKNPADLLPQAERNRWQRLRHAVASEVVNRFENSGRLIEAYFLEQKSPTFSEILPVFLRADRSCEMDDPLDRTWIYLFLATRLLDDLKDGDISPSPENVFAVQNLSLLAVARATKSYGSFVDDVEEIVESALYGQSISLDSSSSQAAVREAAILKNSLLSLPASTKTSVIRGNRELHKNLQLLVQILDDTKDLSIDARSGIRTTVCKGGCSMEPLEQVVVNSIQTGALKVELNIARSAARVLQLEIHEANLQGSTLNDFLKYVDYACTSILRSVDDLKSAAGTDNERATVKRLLRQIEIYAVGS